MGTVREGRVDGRRRRAIVPWVGESQNPGGVACPRATRDRSGVFAHYTTAGCQPVTTRTRPLRH